ncbi:MAG: hypothetical protein LH609_16735 [Rudanella sp.]|nr:hypothetical protein [Rudanella sp.]
MNKKHTSFFSLRALLIVGSFLVTVAGCLQDHPIPNPMRLSAAQGPPFATGLRAPIGLADDSKGNL